MCYSVFKFLTCTVLLVSVHPTFVFCEEIDPNLYLVKIRYTLKDTITISTLFSPFENSLFTNVKPSKFIKGETLIDCEKFNITTILSMTHKRYGSFGNTLKFEELNEVFSKYDVPSLNSLLQEIFALLPLLPDMLEKVDISFTELLINLTDDDKSKVFEILQNGNFTEENIREGLAVANKTTEDICYMAMPILLEVYNQMTFGDIIKIYRILVVEQQEDNLFTNVLENTANQLESFVKIGVWISPTEIIYQSDGLLEVIYDNYLNYVAETANSTFIPYENIYFKYGENVLSTLNNAQQYLRVAKYSVSEEMGNCSYFYYEEKIKQVEVTDLIKKDNSILWKPNNISVYRQGNPLVCSGKLYGFSGQSKDGYVLFATLDVPESNSASYGSSCGFLFTIGLFLNVIFYTYL